MKNRLDKLNKKILAKCKSVDEIERNIPFVSDDVLIDEHEEQIYEISSGIPLGIIGGAVSVAKGFINNGLKRNILNKINNFNKNETNIQIGSGQWTKLLMENSIDEIVKKVNFNRFYIHHYLNHLKNELDNRIGVIYCIY